MISTVCLFVITHLNDLTEYPVTIAATFMQKPKLFVASISYQE